MDGKAPELRVVRQSRDGRRIYDEKGKRALIEAALQSGVSVARLAQEHGINANLLRKWITRYLLEREKGISPTLRNNACDVPLSGEVIDSVSIAPSDSRKPSAATTTPSAFVPVVSVPSAPTSKPPSSMMLTLHVRLSNGVELELGGAIATIGELTTLVQILGRLPCSGSTTP